MAAACFVSNSPAAWSSRRSTSGSLKCVEFWNPVECHKIRSSPSGSARGAQLVVVQFVLPSLTRVCSRHAFERYVQACLGIRRLKYLGNILRQSIVGIGERQ